MSLTSNPTKSADTEQSTISAADVTYFQGLVGQKLAIQLEGKEYLIESRLHPLLVEFEVESLGELFKRMRSGNAAIEDAALEAMTTNETSFFRDGHPFEVLKQHVLPELAASRGPSGHILIWNGACSSGQESYSLAMTIMEAAPELARSPQTKIISTDVSKKMVERCRAGQYSRFEVNRGLPTNLAAKYFEAAGRNWLVSDDLRRMIDVRELNLLERWQGIPRCDVVLLRNVLIYFPVAVKRDILRRIRTDVLREDGCLILGASESTVGLDDGYEPRRIANSNCFFPIGDKG